MTTVGAYEAKTHLPELLRQVAQGQDFLITKHGVPIAKLSPPPASQKVDVSLSIQALKSFRKGKVLGPLKLRHMIEEGRRF